MGAIYTDLTAGSEGVQWPFLRCSLLALYSTLAMLMCSGVKPDFIPCD